MTSQKEMHDFTLITPWETQVEESSINKYCSEFVQPWKFTKTRDLPKVQDKKRAISTCTNLRKRQRTNPIEHTERIRVSKPLLVQNTENQRPFHTIYHQKTQRPERKKVEKPVNVLQELSVKNFIIEGGQQNYNKDKFLKKRQSSYVLKHKFAEFRRSMKDMALQNKQNANMRVIRYQN